MKGVALKKPETNPVKKAPRRGTTSRYEMQARIANDMLNNGMRVAAVTAPKTPARKPLKRVPQTVDKQPNAESDAREEQEPRSATLVEIGQTEARLFRNPDGDACASFKINGRVETCKVMSSRFAHWLRASYYQRYGVSAKKAELKDAADELEAMALFGDKSETLRLHQRIAAQDGAIYLDLADALGKAVKITSEGWDIVAEQPVQFVRTLKMRPLPQPVRGGHIDDLRPFLNVGSEDEFRLIVAWLLNALRPGHPYLILLLNGWHDSGKTTSSKVCRALIDPNEVVLLAPPRDVHSLAISTENAHVLVFDNLSRLTQEMSDTLCRVAKGDQSFAVRQLYTTDGERVFHGHNPVILNGIGNFAPQSDLLDRCIVMTPPPLQGVHRQNEAEFNEAFEEARPRILGALLDAVVRGLRDWRDLKMDGLPRMADSATWFTACETAFGWERGSILRAYENNRRLAQLSTLELSPISQPIQQLVLQHKRWMGTSAELLQVLEQRLGSKPRPSDWPKNARSLSLELDRTVPNLRSGGVQVSRPPRGSKGERLWLLERGEDGNDNDGDPKDSNDGNDNDGDHNDDGGDNAGRDGDNGGDNDARRREISPGTSRWVTVVDEVTLQEGFFSEAEGDAYLAHLLEKAPWQQPKVRKGRNAFPLQRLSAFYGEAGVVIKYNGIVEEALPWTPELLEIKRRVEAETGATFNSVLVNRYRDGQHYTPLHRDDAQWVGGGQTIASVSFGATREFRLRYQPKEPPENETETERDTVSVPLTHGSLLVMAGQTQRTWRHEVPKTKDVVGERVNLTFRLIEPSPPKIAKAAAKPTPQPTTQPQ